MEKIRLMDLVDENGIISDENIGKIKTVDYVEIDVEINLAKIVAKLSVKNNGKGYLERQTNYGNVYTTVYAFGLYTNVDIDGVNTADVYNAIRMNHLLEKINFAKWDYYDDVFEHFQDLVRCEIEDLMQQNHPAGIFARGIDGLLNVFKDVGAKISGLIEGMDEDTIKSILNDNVDKIKDIVLDDEKLN